MCKKLEEKNNMDKEKVEDIVKTAINYAEEKTVRAYSQKNIWLYIYFICSAVGLLELYLSWYLGRLTAVVPTYVLLCLMFGGYFCIFAKLKLPSFYDQNKVTVFYDGPFRMNMPGVRFTNNNWPHILEAVRISICSMTVFIPIISYILYDFEVMGYIVSSVMFAGGVFVPVYTAGRKYQ